MVGGKPREEDGVTNSDNSDNVRCMKSRSTKRAATVAESPAFSFPQKGVSRDITKPHRGL
jgi:hypothetical protein